MWLYLPPECFRSSVESEASTSASSWRAGLEPWLNVEADPFCAAVLAARMADGAVGQGPIWADVRTFDGRPWRGLVDCVSGGSPCQDLSVAGRQAGLDGERSGLWREQRRIVEECEPAFVFWENVGGAVKEALPVVAGELEALGFRAAGCTLRAADVGAPHRLEGQRRRRRQKGARPDADRCGGETVGDPVRGEYAERRGERRAAGEEQSAASRASGSLLAHQWPPRPDDVDGWARWLGPQPGIRRGADGSASPLERAALRLHALGNGVVPQQAAAAFLVCWRRLFGRAEQ